MPVIARPDPLGLKALDQLADDRLNASPGIDQPAGPGLRIALCPTIGGHDGEPASVPVRSELGTPVVPIPQEVARGAVEHFGRGPQIMNGCWRQLTRYDHSRPANPHVRPQAKEGLFSQLIVAKRRLVAQAPTACGAGQSDRRGRESYLGSRAVDHGEPDRHTSAPAAL